MALGDGRFSSRIRGSAAGQVEFQQPAAVTAFVDEQPALVHGDAVGAWQVVAQHAGAAVRAERADPAVHHLGGVRLPSGSNATSSGAMMSPPLALTVSTRPVPTSSALIWLPVTCAM